MTEEEKIFLEKLKLISQTHTCSYNGVLNLLLETALHFSTQEIVNLLEAKKYL